MLAIVWPGDLDDDVALLQAGLFGRAAADDAAEQQPFDVGGVVGNRAGEHAHAGAAGARVRRLLDLGERRRLRRVADALDDRRREADDAIEILVVDLVGGVARTVIVGVRAGEEAERRARRPG